jgi:hypothetical protein
MQKRGHVKLLVYNLLGEEVAVLGDEELFPTNYAVYFNGEGHPSGIYFYSLWVDGEIRETKKMVLVK